jgi:hypothetical protein
MEELDPVHKVELAMLRAEHQKKFQGMIEFLKERIEPGVEYRNSVARVVVSETGAYCELNDLPEEFAGAAGPDVEARSVAPTEAIALLARAVEAVQQANRNNARQCSILALYSRRGIIDRQNCYVFEYKTTDEQMISKPLVIGQFQTDVMPLFFKIKIDADFAPDTLDMPRGLVFCIAIAGDRHLLVRIPFTGEQVTNLSDLPITRTVQ